MPVSLRKVGGDGFEPSIVQPRLKLNNRRHWFKEILWKLNLVFFINPTQGGMLEYSYTALMTDQ